MPDPLRGRDQGMLYLLQCLIRYAEGSGDDLAATMPDPLRGRDQGMLYLLQCLIRYAEGSGDDLAAT